MSFNKFYKKSPARVCGFLSAQRNIFIEIIVIIMATQQMIIIILINDFDVHHHFLCKHFSIANLKFKCKNSSAQLLRNFSIQRFIRINSICIEYIYVHCRFYKYNVFIEYETIYMQVGGTRLIDLLCSNLRDQTIGWDDI